MSPIDKTASLDAKALAPCPFCDKPVMLRKALWPSDGDADFIIHSEPTDCPLYDFSNGTADESIIEVWNRRALQPALPHAGKVSDYWHSIDAAPEDEWVILATSGEHVGQALMLVDEDTGQQTWNWYGGSPVHPNLKPLGWQRMPSPIFTEILPDNRPGGFDGPTGAE